MSIIAIATRESQLIPDPCYRYMMPQLETQLFGKNQSRRTVLVNLNDIGAALQRDTDEIVKYIACRLGVSSTSCSIKGEHSVKELQELVQDYIEQYVLCPTCGLPETSYKVKRSTVQARCAACGHKSYIEEATAASEKVNHLIIKAYRSRPRARTEEGAGGAGVTKGAGEANGGMNEGA